MDFEVYNYNILGEEKIHVNKDIHQASYGVYGICS